MTDLSEMFQRQTDELSAKVAAAEGKIIREGLLRCGVGPSDKISMTIESLGCKLISIDGKPAFRVITESPSLGLGKEYRYTVRAEPV